MEQLAFGLTTAARNSSNRDPSLMLTFTCCTARDEGIKKGESNCQAQVQVIHFKFII